MSPEAGSAPILQFRCAAAETVISTGFNSGFDSKQAPMHRPPGCGVTQPPVQWAFSTGLKNSFRRKPWDGLSGASPHTELTAQH